VRVLERLYGLRKRTWLPPAHWWHRPFIEAYLEALRDGEAMPVPPREARRSLELTVALYRAALTHSVVRLPLEPDSPFYTGVEPGAFRTTHGDTA
jgi:hypothetical protein